MTELRTFSNRRTPCPCGDSSHGFAAFEGETRFGHCHKCGQSFFPEAESRPTRTQIFLPSPNDRATCFVERTQVDRTTARTSPFGQRLKQLTRASILLDWNIGCSADGATLFWYQDAHGRFVNAKAVWFEEQSLHRVKDDRRKMPHFLYSSRQGFRTCLYGEHQLARDFFTHDGNQYPFDTPVILVESEKTAVLMSHASPKYLWLATGGANGLTKSKGRVLLERNVVVLFDCDEAGRRGSERTAKVLLSLGIRHQVLDPVILFSEINGGTTEGIKPGFDVADYAVLQLQQRRAVSDFGSHEEDSHA